MRIPRLHIRFTVRRLMVALAILAVSLALLASPSGWAEQRRSRFRRIYYEHAWKHTNMWSAQIPGNARKLEYHDLMRRKYHWAARYPWLPVWPDPAEPE